MCNITVETACYSIVLEIYRITVIEKDFVWFSKLVSIFDGKIERSVVSRSIDFLSDICVIELAYQDISGLAARCMTIDDDYMPWVEAQYNENIKRV